MRRRAVYLAGLAGLLVGLAAGLWLSEDPAMRRYSQVRPGMTYAEVTEVLGEHPYSGWRPDEYQWMFPSADILVHFDAQGQADQMSFQPRKDRGGLFDRLRRRLPW
jgi:hypothetical protein